MREIQNLMTIYIVEVTTFASFKVSWIGLERTARARVTIRQVALRLPMQRQ